MRSFGKLVAAGFTLTAVLSGCSPANVPDSVRTTTLEVSRGGGLTYYLVEEFGKEYYDLAELTAMAREETADFAGTNGGGASLEKVERLGETPDRVSVVYRFENGDCFSRFTGSSFFYGTVSEALALGYDPGEGLCSAEDGAVIDREQLEENGKMRLIITDARVLIYCPWAVAGIRGAGLGEDGCVDASQAGEPVWILLK